MARSNELSNETRQFILLLRNVGYSMREIAKKLKISYNTVYYSLHRTEQTGSNQNRKRSGMPPRQEVPIRHPTKDKLATKCQYWRHRVEAVNKSTFQSLATHARNIVYAYDKYVCIENTLTFLKLVKSCLWL